MADESQNEMSQNETKINAGINLSRRGGARPGAGRKPNYLKRLADPITAAMILARSDEIKAWEELLNATMAVSVGRGQSVEVPHWAIRLEARKYLTDKRDGKARQAIEHSGPGGGPIQYEDFNLHKLTDSELAELRRLVESASPVA